MIDRRLSIAIISFLIFFLILFPVNGKENMEYTTQHVFYSSKGIILDKFPVIKYPYDFAYIYLDKSHFNLTLVNFNYNYNLTYVEEKFNSEFGRANITFSYHTMNITLKGNTFYISYLNRVFISWVKQNYSNTDLILVFTNYKALKIIDDAYIVIGCAYVESHIAYVFNGVSRENRVYVGMHEVGHLLGLIHTHDSQDIMYPVYHGQTHFGKESLLRLKILHISETKVIT